MFNPENIAEFWNLNPTTWKDVFNISSLASAPLSLFVFKLYNLLIDPYKFACIGSLFKF